MRAAGPRRIAKLLLLLAVLTSGIGGCADDEAGFMSLDPSEYELVMVSGDQQSALAGTVVPAPFVVLVQHPGTGAPQEGVTVDWDVVVGKGRATRGSTLSDQYGEASTHLVLDEDAGRPSFYRADGAQTMASPTGNVRVNASVPGLEPVTFHVHASTPPEIISVSPTRLDPGEAVEIQLTNLPADLPVQALFDGIPGEIVRREGGYPAVLGAVAPPPRGVCGGSQQDVELQLRIGGLTVGYAGLSVTVPADPFQVGRVHLVQRAEDVACAQLPAYGGRAKYMVVALSAEFGAEGEYLVRLGAGDEAFAGQVGAGRGTEVDFHSRLRSFERRLAGWELPPAKPRRDAGLFSGPSLGETRQFYVLNNLEFTEEPLRGDDFDYVTATLDYIGAHTLVYVDDAAPAPELSRADVRRVAEVYDRQLYDVDLDFFGEPPDVDGNDRVIVLLSPTVNSLTPRGSDGMIVGFFFGLDLFNDMACGECAFSNGGEVLYAAVPDPAGQFSDPVEAERLLQFMPGVMAHETQHLINFRYKVFDNAQSGLEDLWLSEALAHMAEELGGDAVQDAALVEDLHADNVGRATRFLNDPSAHSLTASAGYGSLEERGAGWLFLRWVAEQYGDFIFRDLTQAVPNGVANVENQTGEPFFRLFADWAVALWADDQPIPNLAERYQIPKWQLRSVLTAGEPPEYALKPMLKTFAEFRAASISKLMAATSPLYIEIDAAGDSSPLSLHLDATNSAGLAILRFE